MTLLVLFIAAALFLVETSNGIPPPPMEEFADLKRQFGEEVLHGTPNGAWTSGKFQGDIVQKFDAVVAEYGESVAEEAKKSGELEGGQRSRVLRGLGATLSSKQNLWPGGKIYWVWSDEVYADEQSRAAINFAYVIFNQKTRLELVYGTGNGNYVEFVRKSGCWSSVGKVGGRQEISIGKGCENTATVLHEILHAAGMYHEQSSQDRDEYIDIYWNNIQDGKAHNFERASDSSTHGFNFDYKSIMMYGEYSFSKNGQKTINCKGQGCGDQSEMSDSDIKSINFIYSKENYWDDGAPCSIWSTCERCKNLHSWWPSKSTFACGTQDCYKPDTLCHSLSCKYWCCKGYRTKWYWLGFGRCN